MTNNGGAAAEGDTATLRNTGGQEGQLRQQASDKFKSFKSAERSSQMGNSAE